MISTTIEALKTGIASSDYVVADAFSLAPAPAIGKDVVCVGLGSLSNEKTVYSLDIFSKTAGKTIYTTLDKLKTKLGGMGQNFADITASEARYEPELKCYRLPVSAVTIPAIINLEPEPDPEEDEIYFSLRFKNSWFECPMSKLVIAHERDVKAFVGASGYCSVQDFGLKAVTISGKGEYTSSSIKNAHTELWNLLANGGEGSLHLPSTTLWSYAKKMNIIGAKNETTVLVDFEFVQM